MDYILSILDNIILDKIWAKLVPAAAFPPNFNSTKFINVPDGAWLSVVSHLPHPSFDEFLVQSSIVSGSIRLSPLGPFRMAKILHSETVDLHMCYHNDWDTYFILFRRLVLLHVHLRQTNDEAPPFPQKPNTIGDNMQLMGIPGHDHAHSSLLPSRGHGVFKVI